MVTFGHFSDLFVSAICTFVLFLLQRRKEGQGGLNIYTKRGKKKKRQIKGKEEKDTKLCLNGNIAQMELC